MRQGFEEKFAVYSGIVQPKVSHSLWEERLHPPFKYFHHHSEDETMDLIDTCKSWFSKHIGLSKVGVIDQIYFEFMRSKSAEKLFRKYMV